MKTSQSFLWALAGVIVIVVVVIVAERRNPDVIFENEGTMCTADAMQCEDGTWVGRTGPNCQFVCPSPSSSPSKVFLQTKLDQSVSGLDVKIIPLAVIEDSRCPTDVQCIQAGTVRVRAKITSGLGTATEIFTLNSPITTEAEIVTLVDVSPAKTSTQELRTEEYLLTWTVEKR